MGRTWTERWSYISANIRSSVFQQNLSCVSVSALHVHPAHWDNSCLTSPRKYLCDSLLQKRWARTSRVGGKRITRNCRISMWCVYACSVYTSWRSGVVLKDSHAAGGSGTKQTAWWDTFSQGLSDAWGEFIHSLYKWEQKKKKKLFGFSINGSLQFSLHWKVRLL